MSLVRIIAITIYFIIMFFLLYHFVLCNEGALAITTGYADGSAQTQIWLDNVQCRGTEISLLDCSANLVGIHNCIHSEDAGVRCASRSMFKN